MPTNTSETGQNEWIDAPDTNGWKVALRGAIYLIATGFIIYGSLTPFQLGCVAAAWVPHWWKQKARARAMALDAFALHIRQDLKLVVY
jgi:hypothetical protein